MRHLASVFGERIFICTGDSFKWVTLSDVQGGKEKQSPHSDIKCPLCYAASHGLKALPPSTAAIALDFSRVGPPVLSYGTLLISFPPASPLHVRAPPLPFIG